MGQGVYTATMQAVCEETHLPADIMTVSWDKELGEKCGETWASRGTTLSCAAAQHAARKLLADLDSVPITTRAEHRRARPGRSALRQLQQLVGREYSGEYVCNFTTRPGTPEAVLNPTTHLTFSYAAQVVILDDQGKLERVVVANDVGRAINPRLCAEQMEGGVHMGLGYALSENFTSTNGIPDSLGLRDLGIVAGQAHARCGRHPDRGARRSRRLRRERRRRDRLRRHRRRRRRRAALLRWHPPRQPADGRRACGGAAPAEETQNSQRP